MASGYRNAAGVDFDNLFEAGTTAATNYRRSNGTPLRYAARGTVPKGPNVGFRLANGTDLSNLWLPKGSAPPVPGFNGQWYSGIAAAPSGATGTTSAQLRLTFAPSGVWLIERTIAGAIDGEGTATLDSGVWLPPGGNPADYFVQYSAIGINGTESNGAPTAAQLTVDRSYSLTASINSAAISRVIANREVTATLTRTGLAGVVAICNFDVEAWGQA